MLEQRSIKPFCYIQVSCFSCDFLIDMVDQERKGRGLSKAQIAMAMIGSFILCFLVGASISVSLILWVRNVKRSKLKGQKIARLPKGHLSIKYSEVSLLSPGVVKFDQFEFPRSNLELQDIIGKFISLLLIWCMHLIPLYMQVKDGLERCIRVKHMELCLMLQI